MILGLEPDDQEAAGSPHDPTADGLETSLLSAQLARLNDGDRGLAERRLGLVSGDRPIDVDGLLREEKAIAKLRHPTLARVWRAVAD